MKSYAKSLPGSVFTVDRRSELDEIPDGEAGVGLTLVDEGEGGGGSGGSGSSGAAGGTVRSGAAGGHGSMNPSEAGGGGGGGGTNGAKPYARLVGSDGEAGAFAPKL